MVFSKPKRPAPSEPSTSAITCTALSFKDTPAPILETKYGYSAAFRKGWVRVIGTGREINIEFGEKVKPKPLKTAQKMSIGKKYAYVEDPWVGQLGYDLSKRSDIDKFKKAMKV